MKNVIKRNKVNCYEGVDIMYMFCLSIIEIVKMFLKNCEYKNDIGTIYKSGIRESNKILRFKERFKSTNKNVNVFNYKQQMYWEVI